MSTLRSFRPWAALVAILAVVIAASVTLVQRSTAQPMDTVTADFVAAPGLYAGNQVEVLGIPVGHVVSVTPTPLGATVRLSIEAKVALPRDVKARILAPQLISDRFIQLDPPYESGPKLTNGAVIPIAHTAVTLSIDEIFKSLDTLVSALGPKGANSNGALSRLVHGVATTFGGDGPQVNQTIKALGQGLGSLSSDAPQLEALINSVGSLSTVAQANEGQYSQFASQLNSVSSVLASDRSDVGTALTTLQSALAQFVTFLSNNSTSLAGSFVNLRAFANTLSTQVSALAQTFRTLPVAAQNVTEAFDPNAPGGPGIRARYDATTGVKAFANSICGNPLTRLLSVALATTTNPDTKSNEDMLCGVAGVAADLPAPPGASSGPNLSLTSLVAGQS